MITAHDIAKQYNHNPADVFNAMIDAIVACGPEHIQYAQALEVLGLAIQDIPTIGINHA